MHSKPEATASTSVRPVNLRLSDKAHLCERGREPYRNGPLIVHAQRPETAAFNYTADVKRLDRWRTVMMLLYGDFETLSEQHILVRFFGWRRERACARSKWIADLETRLQAGSNGNSLRHTFAFRVQIGSKPKACKPRVFSERSL